MTIPHFGYSFQHPSSTSVASSTSTPSTTLIELDNPPHSAPPAQAIGTHAHHPHPSFVFNPHTTTNVSPHTLQQQQAVAAAEMMHQHQHQQNSHHLYRFFPASSDQHSQDHDQAHGHGPPIFLPFLQGQLHHPQPIFHPAFGHAQSHLLPPQPTPIVGSCASPIDSGSMSTQPTPQPPTPVEMQSNTTPVEEVLIPIPGKTNWSPAHQDPPSTVASPAPSLPPPSTAGTKIHPPPLDVVPPPAPTGRTRRAAASKARSNISKITTQLRSPPPPRAVAAQPTTLSDAVSAVSTTATDSTASTIASGASASSRPSSRASASVSAPLVSRPPARPYHHARNPAPMSGTSTIIIELPPPAAPKYTKKPPAPPRLLQIKGCRPDGQLLPAPPGCILEVNDLLILHPPATDAPAAIAQPINQYSHAPCPEGYKSAFEMYTCRVCAKTYDGKNARSVARRHLQDKHGVPLSMQERRTRWDLEADRPKTEEESREKTLRIKRDWAQKARQLLRLEKVHAKFLEQYGPEGVHPPCKTHLVAPSIRVRPASDFNGKSFPSGWLKWNQIPQGLREGLAEMNGTPIPIVEPGDEMIEGASESSDVDDTDDDDGAETGQKGSVPMQRSVPAIPVSIPTVAAVAPRLRWKSRKRIKSDIISTSESLSSSSTSASVLSDDGALHRQFPSASLRAPPMHGRSVSAGQVDTLRHAAQWYQAWVAPTQADEQNLRAVLAQHSASNMSSASTVADQPIDTPRTNTPLSAQSAQSAQSARSVHSTHSSQSAPQSPMPLQTIPEQSVHGWILPSSMMWYGQQTYAYSETPANKHWQPIESATVATRADDVESPSKIDGDAGEETALVAESLIDLRSTPARPDDVNMIRPSLSSRTATAEPSSDLPIQTASSAIRSLLGAPEITPRPTRPVRAKSFIQPFPKSRPEAANRSLSFNSDTNLDDPFAFTPSTFGSMSATKKRRSTIASPSPLTSKRKKADQSPRLPMGILRPNAPISALTANNGSAGNQTLSWGEMYDPKAVGGLGGAPVGVGAGGQGGVGGLGGVGGTGGLGGAFMTPIRPARLGAGAAPGTVQVPSSLSKVWQFSSPGCPGDAASLGLVPQWGNVGGTPGVSGMVGSDTPSVKR